MDFYGRSEVSSFRAYLAQDSIYFEVVYLIRETMQGSDFDGRKKPSHPIPNFFTFIEGPVRFAENEKLEKIPTSRLSLYLYYTFIGIITNFPYI